MNVKAIAITQPVGELADIDIKEFIAYVARVSNPENQNNHLTADRLLKYLAKHRHFSPFEMANIVMEIETTRDIARQILRHRSFTFQEFSQRYADPTQLGFTLREARLQDQKNRQNSVATEDEVLAKEWWWKQQKALDSVQEAYKWAIENGIAKEQARAVLPEGMTNSRLYMNGTVRSWIHYCDLRSKNGTQKEHMDIAIAAWAEVTKLIPALQDVLIG